MQRLCMYRPIKRALFELGHAAVIMTIRLDKYMSRITQII